MNESDGSLHAQHAHIDRELEAVVAAGRAGRWSQYRRHFDALREGLAQHMAFEEEALFPLLEERAAAAKELERAEELVAGIAGAGGRAVVVGRPGLSLTESRAHFALWALMAAPLITPHAPPSALIVYWRARHVCSPEEINLIVNFANHAAMAIPWPLPLARSETKRQGKESQVGEGLLSNLLTE